MKRFLIAGLVLASGAGIGIAAVASAGHLREGSPGIVPASHVQVAPLEPEAAFGEPSAPYCREFHTTATIAGQTAEVYGTACRGPDGAWEIVAVPPFGAQ